MNPYCQALPQEDTNKDGIVSWEEYVTNTFGKQYLKFETMKPSDDTDDYVRLFIDIFVFIVGSSVDIHLNLII